MFKVKVKVSLEGKMIKWSSVELVRAIPVTSTFMHGFQNCVAQLFIEIFFSGKLKVKVSPEGETIKWSLASVDIIN